MQSEQTIFNGIFSGNALKLLACAFMLVDHIGAILFPELSVLLAGIWLALHPEFFI